MKLYKISLIKNFTQINPKLRNFVEQKKSIDKYTNSINEYFLKMYNIEEDKKEDFKIFDEDFKNNFLNNQRVAFNLVNNYLSLEKKYGFDENLLEIFFENFSKYYRLQGDHPIMGLDYIGKRLFDSDKWMQIEDTVCFSLQSGVEVDYSKTKNLFKLLNTLNIKSNKIKTVGLNNIKSFIWNKIISNEKYGLYKNNFYINDELTLDKNEINNIFLNHITNIKKNLKIEKDWIEVNKISNDDEIISQIDTLNIGVKELLNSNLEVINSMNNLRDLYYKFLNIQKEEYIMKNKNIVYDLLIFEEKLLELGVLTPKDLLLKNNELKQVHLDSYLNEYGSDTNLLNIGIETKDDINHDINLKMEKNDDFDFCLFFYEFINFINNQIDGEHDNIKKLKELFGINFDIENLKEIGVLNNWDYFKQNLYFDETFHDLRNLVNDNIDSLKAKFNTGNEKLKFFMLLFKLNFKNIANETFKDLIEENIKINLDFKYIIELLNCISLLEYDVVKKFMNSELFDQIKTNLEDNYNNFDLTDKIEFYGNLIFFTEDKVINNLLLKLYNDIINESNFKEIIEGNERDFKLPIKPFYNSLFNLLLYFKANKLVIPEEIENKILYMINSNNSLKNLNDPIKSIFLKIIKSNISISSSNMIDYHSKLSVISYFLPDVFVNNNKNQLIGLYIEGSNIINKNSNLNSIFRYEIIQNLNNNILKSLLNINYEYKVLGYDLFLKDNNYSVFDVKSQMKYKQCNIILNLVKTCNSKIINNLEKEEVNINNELLSIIKNTDIIKLSNKHIIFKKYLLYLFYLCEAYNNKINKDLVLNHNSLNNMNTKIHFISNFIKKLYEQIPEDYIGEFNEILTNNNLKNPLEIIDELLINCKVNSNENMKFNFIGKRIGINVIGNNLNDFKLYEEFLNPEFLKNDDYFIFNSWNIDLKNKIDLVQNEKNPKIYNYHSTLKNIAIPTFNLNEFELDNIGYNLMWESFYNNINNKNYDKNIKLEKFSKNLKNQMNLSLKNKFKVNLMNLNYDLKLIKNYDIFLKDLFNTEFINKLLESHLNKYILNNKLLEDLIEENNYKSISDNNLVFDLLNFSVDDYNLKINENNSNYNLNNEYIENLEKENLTKKKVNFWYKILYFKLPEMRKKLKTSPMKKEFKKLKNYVKKNYFLAIRDYKNQYHNSEYFNDKNKKSEVVYSTKLNIEKKVLNSQYYSSINEIRIASENNIIKSSILYKILNKLNISCNEKKFIEIWKKYIELNPLNYSEIVTNNLSLSKIKELTNNDKIFFRKYFPHFDIDNFNDFYLNDILVIFNLFLNNNNFRKFENELLKKSYSNLGYGIDNLFDQNYIKEFSNNHKFLVDFNDKKIFKEKNKINEVDKDDIMKLMNFKRGKTIFDIEWAKKDSKSLSDFLSKIHRKSNKWGYLNLWIRKKEKEIKQRPKYFINEFIKSDEELKKLLKVKEDEINNILNTDISNYDQLQLKNIVDQIISKIKILSKNLPLNINKIMYPILKHKNLHLLDKMRLINYLNLYNIDLEAVNENKFLFEKEIDLEALEIDNIDINNFDIINELKNSEKINEFMEKRYKSYLNDN